METIYLLNIGYREYRSAWALQKRLFNLVSQRRDIHFLILTEHPPVFTIGKSGSNNNILVSREFLHRQKIDLVAIDRGGDITFHGPGQIVGYPILNLNAFNKDIHWYMRNLEEVIIRVLHDFGINGKRIAGLTGVWVNDQKICAMGVKVTRWVSMHGFALNVSTDLNYFQYIIPCGIPNKGITSLYELTGNNITLNKVMESALIHFADVFDAEISPISENDVGRLEKEIFIAGR